jgi:amino acid permease
MKGENDPPSLSAHQIHCSAASYFSCSKRPYLTMIVILLALLGAFIGWRTARKKGGDRLDKLQYAAAFLIAFSIIGLFATLLIHNLL